MKAFLDWALSIWPILAFLFMAAIAASGWVIRHDFSKRKQAASEEGIRPNNALRKAQDKHLDGIQALITEFESTLTTPRLSNIFLGMPSIPTQDIEANPLFCCLKEHLPSSTFWKDYSVWKDDVRAYIEGCQKIIKVIGEAASDSISEDILKDWGTETVAKAMGWFPPFDRMMKEYREKAISDSELQSLLAQVKDIKSRLHEYLQEGLESGDYIKHTCQLCPIK